MTTFAILAEDKSDAKVLAILVKRIAEREDLKVLKMGFGGGGHLRTKAANQMDLYAGQGASRFIICHDSDGKKPEDVRKWLREGIGGKIDLKHLEYAIIVPVQELEAWIIADERAIASAIPSLRIAEVRKPEGVASPKEYLETRSREGRSRPLFVPPIHNEKVAAFLDVPKVYRKCHSFRELVDFVRAK